MKPCSLRDYLREPMSGKTAITFDDGYESVYTEAYPILQEMNAGCTVFLITGYIGGWNRWEVNIGFRKFRHLTWAMTQEMELAEFASHTVTHRCLTKIPPEEIRLELTASKKVIEDKIGRPVRYLSPPFGRYNDTVLRIARECGYEAVCTMNPGRISSSGGHFVIPRCGVYLIDNDYTFKCKLGAGKLAALEQYKLRLINTLSIGTIIVKKLRKESDLLDFIEK
ncbi:polysaccharide deacetylase family protein [bacterium]|nr:polysaccharide deacetylase family protein [bacterium]